jgi:Flp pilus assembly protein TadG
MKAHWPTLGFWFTGRAIAPAERKRGILRSQSGQSLVELALLTPLLLLMVVGTVEMGRYAYLSIVLGNSARAGAAYGAQGLAYSVDNAGITNAATNDFNDNGETSGLSVNPSVTCGCDTNGSPSAGAASCTGNNAGICGGGSHWVVTVHVTVSATFKALFKYPGIPATIKETTTAVMRVKQD